MKFIQMYTSSLRNTITNLNSQVPGVSDIIVLQSIII